MHRGIACALVVGALGCDARITPSSLAIDACISYTACFGGDVGRCVDVAMPILLSSSYYKRLMAEGVLVMSPRTYQCLAQARSDCSYALACLGPYARTECDPNQPETCQGSVAGTCFSDRVYSYDCGEAGLGCMEDSQGNATCGEPCQGSDARCDGDFIVTCVNGVLRRENCSIEGATCELWYELDSPMIRCVGKGEACDPETESYHCEGDTIFSCDPRTKRFLSAYCPDWNPLHKCKSVGDRDHCMNDYQGCMADSARCGGSKIFFCSLGQNVVTDCRDHGFTKCDYGEDLRAYCM